MERLLVRSKLPYQADVVKPIELGGTGAATLPDIVSALGGISKDVIGEPLGIVPLDNSNKIPAQYFPALTAKALPALIGPTALYTSQTFQFKINNFDLLETYTVSVDYGTVSRSGDIITFTTPAAPMNCTLTINERNYVFNVVVPYVEKPAILTPLNNATNVKIIPAFSATIFNPKGITEAQLHASWQVATDINFTNIVAESLNDTNSANFHNWKPPALNLLTDYYVRVRYAGVTLPDSPWSDAVKFTTAATAYVIPTNEEAILASPGSSYLGWNVSIDDSMTRIVAGANNRVYVFAKTNEIWAQEATFIAADVGSTSPWGFAGYACISGDGNRMAVVDPVIDGGKAYVFFRTGTTWALEATVTGSDVLVGDYFGSWSIALNTTGDVMIVGSNSQNSGQGAAYVFTRTGTVWTQDAKFSDSAGQAEDRLGDHVTIDSLGTRVTVTSRKKDHDSLTDAGAVFVFVKADGTWSQEAMLVAPDAAASDGFGQCAQISGDGTRIIVSATYASPDYTGKCYVYSRSGSVWTYEATLMNDDYLTVDPNQNGGFGAYQIGFNYTGDVVAIGCPYSNVGTVLDTGAVYIFTRSGTTWTQEAKITASDQANDAWYGECVTMSSDGTKIVVGAGNAISNSNGGAVYVYN